MNNATRMPSAGAGKLAKSCRGWDSVTVTLPAALADNGRVPGPAPLHAGRRYPPQPTPRPHAIPGDVSSRDAGRDSAPHRGEAMRAPEVAVHRRAGMI